VLSRDRKNMDHLVVEKWQDRVTQRHIERLLQVQTQQRWLFNAFIWLTVGTAALWHLHEDIALWLEFFTWSAVRISLQNNRLAFLGLGLCVSLSLSTLIWQSWHILWGIGKTEDRQLRLQVAEILAAGEEHPLWRWVVAERV
jgi:hypothetical protein